MPKIHKAYNPEAEGDEERIAGVAMRYPLGALVGDITFEDDTVTLGNVPIGAVIVGAIVGVSVDFNAETTNVLTIGYGAELDEIVADGDVDPEAVGTTVVAHNAIAAMTEEVSVKAKYAQTGGAATTGGARVLVFYAIPFAAWPAETEPAPGLEPGKVHFPPE